MHVVFVIFKFNFYAKTKSILIIFRLGTVTAIYLVKVKNMLLKLLLC